jgi:hypothetical protein
MRAISRERTSQQGRRAPQTTVGDRGASLTDQELRILAHVVAGLTKREMAVTPSGLRHLAECAPGLCDLGSPWARAANRAQGGYPYQMRVVSKSLPRIG